MLSTSNLLRDRRKDDVNDAGIFFIGQLAETSARALRPCVSRLDPQLRKGRF